MYGIFGIMVSKGIMNNQHDMTSRLKRCSKILKTIHGLTDQECDECLLYFSENTLKVAAFQLMT